MKTRLMMTVVIALLPLGCGQATEQAKRATQSGGMTSEEQAANALYLDDVEDSAADESTTATEEDTAVDESVTDDTKDRRLDQMVDMMFAELDTDESGALSLEEFLAGPQKRAENKEVDEDRQAKMTERMTEDFSNFAGDDTLLSADELKQLLREVAPRVGRHRHKKFPGKHKERVKKSWEEIVTEYDTDGDGKLNQEEFEAMEKDRQPPPRGPRGPHGKGGRGEGKGPHGNKDQPVAEESVEE
jgi:Ca2+-binding EF-hand superfamily protein